MTKIARANHVKEVERVVEHLFEDWMNKNIEDMSQYLHHHVVMVESGTNRRHTGIEQIIESYRDFVEEAEITNYKITDLMIDLFDTTAIAHFSYRIQYRVENTNYDETNTDILVLKKHETRWQIIWRSQMIGT